MPVSLFDSFASELPVDSLDDWTDNLLHAMASSDEVPFAKRQQEALHPFEPFVFVYVSFPTTPSNPCPLCVSLCGVLQQAMSCFVVDAEGVVGMQANEKVSAGGCLAVRTYFLGAFG